VSGVRRFFSLWLYAGKDGDGPESQPKMVSVGRLGFSRRTDWRGESHKLVMPIGKQSGRISCRWASAV